MLLGILLAIHILVCIALIAVILLQRSEGGALGMGGGGQGAFMTARGAGDLLTRVTAILATVFFVLSLALTLMVGRGPATGSVVDRLTVEGLNLDAPPPAPAEAPLQAPTPTAPGLEAPVPVVPGLNLNLPVEGQVAPVQPGQP